MKVLEIMQLYQDLIRKEYVPFYKVSVKSKTAFKKLKAKLDKKNIDIEDFVRVQFQCKGKRMFPNQLNSKYALERYVSYIELQNVEGLHNQQYIYLKRFMECGYSMEEALAIDVFYYYFRCMMIKEHPKEWKIKVDKEIQNIPYLKKIIKKGASMQ
jgi:hypothetical protein